MTPAQSKGKARTVLKKTGGKSEARKTRDALACHLNHFHSRLFQIRAKVKEMEVEHAVVMLEVSEIGGPRGHGPVDSFLPSVLRLVQVKKKCKVRLNGSGFSILV